MTAFMETLEATSTIMGGPEAVDAVSDVTQFGPQTKEVVASSALAEHLQDDTVEVTGAYFETDFRGEAPRDEDGRINRTKLVVSFFRVTDGDLIENKLRVPRHKSSHSILGEAGYMALRAMADSKTIHIHRDWGSSEKENYQKS